MYDRKKCEKCKYSSWLRDGEVCCMYIVIEQHRRGCYGKGICPKFEERTEPRKAINGDGGFYYED